MDLKEEVARADSLARAPVLGLFLAEPARGDSGRHARFAQPAGRWRRFEPAVWLRPLYPDNP